MRRVWRAVGVVAVAVVVASCAATPVTAPVDPGTAGSAGPCGVRRTNHWNPLDSRFRLVVFEPTGIGAPFTGGTCADAERPVVLFAHGYTATASELYQGLIDHLVGHGFVVVFQGYTTDYDPEHQYRVVDTGFVQGVRESGRVDVDRIGVVGHSFGGGMTPWLVQQAAARGWGTEATFAVMFAPWFAQLVGDGPIDLPSHTRAAVVAYEEDVFVDARIGIEIFGALDLPASHREHVTLFTDRRVTPPLVADHLGPVSIEGFPFLGSLVTDHYDRWSAMRTVDSVAGCALAGRWCDVDLSDTGRLPDGRPVVPAVVSDHPRDVGPPALQECQFVLNQRRCP